MRAERDRRAAILNAEGIKQSQILQAEGERQAQILRAEGTAQARVLQAEGESRAILQVFDAIHAGNADSKVLAYQYLQTLPQMANGTANKVWVVPSEFTSALGSIAQGFTQNIAGRANGIVANAVFDDSEELQAEVRRAKLAELGGQVLPSVSDAIAEAERQSEAASIEATGVESEALHLETNNDDSLLNVVEIEA